MQLSREVGGVRNELEEKEQLVTRVKRGLECAGHWLDGIWAKYRLESPSLGVELCTAESAGRLSSTLTYWTLW